MTLIERIAILTDADLASLHVNALRLSAADGARSRAAADLLPALEAEIGARKVRAAEGAAEGKAPPAAKPKRRRSPA